MKKSVDQLASEMAKFVYIAICLTLTFSLIFADPFLRAFIQADIIFDDTNSSGTVEIYPLNEAGFVPYKINDDQSKVPAEPKHSAQIDPEERISEDKDNVEVLDANEIESPYKK